MPCKSYLALVQAISALAVRPFKHEFVSLGSIVLAFAITQSATSQTTSFIFSGQVPQYGSNLSQFSDYAVYTVTLDIDYAAPQLSFSSNTSRWLGAVDLRFDYMNGTYVGMAENLDLWMQGTNAYVSIDRGNDTVLSFPQVDGLDLANTTIMPYFMSFQDSGADFSGSPSLAVLDFQEFIGVYAVSRLYYGNVHGNYFNGVVESVTTVVPEPSTYGLMIAIGGFAIALLRRRLRRP